MKILLTYISGMPDRKDPYISLLPTGLCTLQACLRAEGHDAVIANFSGWSPGEIRAKLTGFRPDLAGISIWTHNRHASLELARLIRDALPGCTILAGGAHASFSSGDILSGDGPVDAVVIGEGELTLREIVSRIDLGADWRSVPGIAVMAGGAVTVTETRPLITDLDRLPSGADYLEHSIGVDIPLQAEFIITARGCPSACHFCSSPRFWGRKVRFRSPEAIVAEIASIRSRYGLIYFSLRDDTFTANRSRTIDFCRRLIDSRLSVLWNCQSRVTALDEELAVWMKRAGCECIQLGVESGSPDILARLGKKITPEQVIRAADIIRKVGMNLSVFLISDVPGETDDDLRRTIELVRRIRPDDGYVSPLAYFPGTAIYDAAVADGHARSDLFVSSPETALYAAGRPGNASRRLLRQLSSGSRNEGEERFQDQKRLLGFCATTSILAGEYYRQRQQYREAMAEFREITEQEPDNPWGWYLLAELHNEAGSRGKAAECYRRVLDIVPGHGPSLRAVAAKKKRGS